MQGGCHQTFLGNDTTMALQNPNFPQKNMAISENFGIYKASRNISCNRIPISFSKNIQYIINQYHVMNHCNFGAPRVRICLVKPWSHAKNWIRDCFSMVFILESHQSLVLRAFQGIYIFCYSHKTWFHQCNNKLPSQPNGLEIPTNKEGRTCSKLTARKRRCLYIHKLHVCHVHGHPYSFIAISGRNLGEQGPLWRTILPSSQ